MAHILLVDDEDSYLEVLSDVLTIAGHKVARAHDGREALEAAMQAPPDLIVTDHMMPRMTGVELLKSLRQTPQLAHVPTILVSAIRPNGYELATRYLRKPVHVDTVHRTVGELVEPRSSAASGANTASFAQTREEALNWVAHEIKNPLATAMMNIEVMLANGANEFQRRHLAMMKRQLERMDELVVSVLDAAALDDGRVILHKDPVNLAAFVEQLTDDWRASFADQQITLSINRRPVCAIDRERVRVVLDNLVSNAAKYGGAARRIEISVDGTDDMAHIDVRDHGVGIPPQQIDRIFDRFHRASHGGRGHGLGLYIAAALARLHGGAIEVDSKVGEGSTFRLKLPTQSIPSNEN
jgi:signal transduction histidine kinase